MILRNILCQFFFIVKCETSLSSASSGTLKYTLISYIWKRPITASRDTLWTVLLAYGCPKKIVSIIKLFYNNFSCIVIHKKLIAGLVQCRKRGALRLRPVTHGILSSHIDLVMQQKTGHQVDSNVRKV